MCHDEKQISDFLEMAWRREGWITKGNRETFRDNRYIHYLDCDDGFMVAY